jgi:hypothetical protein
MRAPLACAMLASAQSINGLLEAPAFCKMSSRASLSDRSLSARVKNSAGRTIAIRATLRMDAAERISSYLRIPEERIMQVT